MSNNIYDHSFKYNDVFRFLNTMKDIAILQKFKITEFYFDENSDGSHIISKIIPAHTANRKPENLYFDCVIGIRCLHENMDKYGYVRDMDFLFCAKHIMHEARHLYQNFHTYQNPLEGQTLDMARMDMIASTFEGYRRSVYFYLPSEIDAEIHALKDTVSYFDKNFPSLNARKLLYEKYKEYKTNRVWHSGMGIFSFDDMVKSLERLQSLYLHVPRNTIFDDRMPMDRNYGHQLKRRKWCRAILNAPEEECIGPAYDEKLAALSLYVSPVFCEVHAGMEEEKKRLMEKYNIPKSIGESITDLKNSLIRDEFTEWHL